MTLSGLPCELGYPRAEHAHYNGIVKPANAAPTASGRANAFSRRACTIRSPSSDCIATANGLRLPRLPARDVANVARTDDGPVTLARDGASDLFDRASRRAADGAVPRSSPSRRGARTEFVDPYGFAPDDRATTTCYLFNEGRLLEAWRMLGARADDAATALPACASPCGRPMPSGFRVVGDFNRWDGRVHPLTCARRERRVGAVRARARGRRALQVRAPQSRRPALVFVKTDPYGARVRAAAGDRRARDGATAPTAGATRDWLARRAAWDWQHAPINDLRGARGLVEAPSRRALLQLARAGRPARSLRRRPRLHARRADADHRASARRVVGLPDHRLFRADVAPRHARRLPRVRRRAATRRASA